jgi:hypothetical protein
MAYVELTAVVKAFSNEPAKKNAVRVYDNGKVLAYDSKAGFFSSCHSIPDADMEKLQKIKKIWEEEVTVEHNSGTFGPNECLRAVGTGDTRRGEYEVRERVGDGFRRVIGCDPKTAPGRARISRDYIASRRELLNKLAAC